MNARITQYNPETTEAIHAAHEVATATLGQSEASEGVVVRDLGAAYDLGTPAERISLHEEDGRTIVKAAIQVGDTTFHTDAVSVREGHPHAAPAASLRLGGRGSGSVTATKADGSMKNLTGESADAMTRMIMGRAARNIGRRLTKESLSK